MSLIRFIGDGRSFLDLDHDDFIEQTAWTHAMPAAGPDYTLCGDTLDGDTETLGSFEHVPGKTVTCPVCVDIIKHCKSYRVKS
jgi:hypothetical protein